MRLLAIVAPVEGGMNKGLDPEPDIIPCDWRRLNRLAVTGLPILLSLLLAVVLLGLSRDVIISLPLLLLL